MKTYQRSTQTNEQKHHQSTVDIGCSHTSSSTPCTIHDKVGNSGDEFFFTEGRNNYLLTCLVSYFVSKVFFFCFHNNRAKVVYGELALEMLIQKCFSYRFFFFFCGYMKLGLLPFK